MNELRVTARRVDAAWVLLILVAAADLLLYLLSLGGAPWRIGWSGEAWVAAGCLLLLALRHIYGRLRPDPRLSGLAHIALLFIAYTNLVAALSYFLAGALQRPLIDAALAAADRAAGLDWPACYRWLHDQPARWSTARFLYNSEGPQVLLLILVLGTRRPHRAREFFLGFAVCSLAVSVLGALLPAAGAYVHYAVPDGLDRAYVRQYLALRDGLRVFDVRTVQGIVQFPSFHAALAVLCAYASRGTWLWWPALLLDVAIVVVTPVAGGHHFTDVGAGLLLAAAALWGGRRLGAAQSTS